MSLDPLCSHEYVFTRSDLETERTNNICEQKSSREGAFLLRMHRLGPATMTATCKLTFETLEVGLEETVSDVSPPVLVSH